MSGLWLPFQEQLMIAQLKALLLSPAYFAHSQYLRVLPKDFRKDFTSLERRERFQPGLTAQRVSVQFVNRLSCCC